MKKWKYVLGIILFLALLSFLIVKLVSDLEPIQENEILVVKINGIISNSDGDNIFSSADTNSDSIISLLKKAKDSKNIKAVILEINSPGGTVVASKEIANAVKEFNKPKVALIRDVGASGAYWIASSADKIVADELSITGSIGVISSYLQFSDLFEKYGITYERLVSGKYKDAGSPYKELNDEERGLIQSKLNKIDQIFLDDVKINRNLEDTYRIETGEFFLGIEAKELGLVDYLGNKNTAFEIAKNLSNLEEAKLVEFKERESVFDVLNRLNANAFYYLGQGIGTQLYLNSKNNNLEINAI